MAVLGLGSKKKMDGKVKHTQPASEDEDAKQVLEQMEKKKQSTQDTCMFC